MNRRTALLACALVAVGGSSAPALAAKAKPKPITGTYAISNVTPDPTYEAAMDPGCSGSLPGGKDIHPFTVPAAGTLQVVLDGDDPTKGGVGTPVGSLGPDWDLYVSSPAGVEGESTGGSSHEEVVVSFKGKTEVTFDACNNTGAPNAKVTYTFTYK